MLVTPVVFHYLLIYLLTYLLINKLQINKQFVVQMPTETGLNLGNFLSRQFSCINAGKESPNSRLRFPILAPL